MKGLPFKGALVASAAAVALLTTPPAQAQVAEQLVNELEQMDAAQRAAVQRALRDQLQVPQQGSDRVSLLINGQVNKALVYADNGNQSNLMATDNLNSGSRFRLIGSGRINEDVTVGTQFELQTDVSDSSGRVNFGGGGFSGASSPGLSVRKSELWFDSATMGRVWLGQGSMAADNISQNDLTGTAVVLLQGNPHLIGSSLNFWNSATNMPAAVTAGTLTGAFWDAPRRGRIRYDTPSLGGILTLSTSWANSDSYDVAARAGGRVEGHRWRIRFGATRGGTANNNNQGAANDWAIGGSASIATSFGMVASFGAGRGDGAANPAVNHQWQYGGKLGWNFDASPLGTTAVTASWYRGKRSSSVAAMDAKSNVYGVELVQNVDAIAGELFAAARRFDYSDSTANSYDNIWLGTVGSRIRF